MLTCTVACELVAYELCIKQHQAACTPKLLCSYTNTEHWSLSLGLQSQLLDLCLASIY